MEIESILVPTSWNWGDEMRWQVYALNIVLVDRRRRDAVISLWLLEISVMMKMPYMV